MIKSYQSLVGKIFWSLAPLGWGYFIWFMLWGLGSSLIPYSSLNFVFQVLFAIGIINLFFRPSLTYAEKNYQPTFFGHSFGIPPWWIFMVVVLLATSIKFTPLNQISTIQSLVGGIIFSAILEDFVARSFFIKYKMNLIEFIIFNTISALSFTFMHAFYMQEWVSAFELLQRGHFGFTFMLGIIAYKTQRIELTILLHMLSNLMRYTIPVCLFDCPYPSIIAIIFSFFVEVICLLCLAGCSYKQKSLK